MTHDNIVAILMDDFGSGNFALVNSALIVEHGSVDNLYDIAVGEFPTNLGRIENERLLFRSAYILEHIYFDNPNMFKPFINRFLTNFATASNGSARRHFTKIMSHLLTKVQPSAEVADQIAQACVEWITEPRVRVAVQIGAIEVLLKLQIQVEWLKDLLPDLLETLRTNPSPAMQVRLRQWKQCLHL